MDAQDKGLLLDASLERAAGQLGDITPLVYETYYQRCPEARAKFTELYPGGAERLEGEMVEQALYCLMEWFRSPGEIEIVLLGTVPHHIETLGIEPYLFSELIIAVCDTLEATVPDNAADERAVWAELRGAMLELFKVAASYARPRG